MKHLKTFLESNKTIHCICGWKWKLDDGGKDPYTCHKCGHVNKPTQTKKNNQA